MVSRDGENKVGIIYSLRSHQAPSGQFILRMIPSHFCRTIVLLASGKFRPVLLPSKPLLVLRYVAIFRWIVVLLIFWSRRHLHSKRCLRLSCFRCCPLLHSSSVCPECKCCDCENDKGYSDADSRICAGREGGCGGDASPSGRS